MSMLTNLVHKEVTIRWIDGSVGCFKILSHDGMLVRLQPLQMAPIDAAETPFLLGAILGGALQYCLSPRNSRAETSPGENPMLEFDTLNYSESLQRSGFSEEQAKALTETRLEIERSKNEIKTLRDEVNTLKVGRPASEDALHKLELRMIPVENFLGNWPWLLAMIAMVAAIVSLLLTGIPRS